MLNSAKLKLNGVDQELESAYQKIATARGSNFINFDVLNPRDLGANTQKEIEKMMEDIKTSVDVIKKMAEIQEKGQKQKQKDISKAANDYVIVNPTSSNDARTSAEYNRGFAMGVKSSFIVAGSVVAAGYLMKGAEGLYKKVKNKMKKEEKTTIGNQVVVNQQMQQPQIGQQVIQQQVVQVPQMNQTTQIVNQQQVINNPVQ